MARVRAAVMRKRIRSKDMSAWEYRQTIARLGLSQSAAGRLLGYSSTVGREWGQVGPPSGAAILLRLMVAMNLTPAQVYGALGEGEDLPPSEDRRPNARYREPKPWPGFELR